MHHFMHEGTGFLSNSDLSGDVEICVGEETLNVPGEALIAFVADYVRREKIAKLEQADDAELLGLATREGLK